MYRETSLYEKDFILRKTIILVDQAMHAVTMVYHKSVRLLHSDYSKIQRWAKIKKHLQLHRGVAEMIGQTG